MVLTRRHVLHHGYAKVFVPHGVQPRHRVPQQRAQLPKRRIHVEVHVVG
jgi:hypothetical protein